MHVEDQFIVAETKNEEGDRCVPTQRFACWKGTSRLAYDASLEDEVLHKQICSCEKPCSNERAIQTGRITISAADELETEAITLLFRERTVVVNRCNFPEGASQLGSFFGNVILRKQLLH